MERRKVWSREDVQLLDLVSQPVWIYSCGSQRITWGNKAAQAYFQRDVEQLTAFKFSNLPEQDAKPYRTLNALIQDEVEMGGLEQIQTGYGRRSLPGVIPHEEIQKSEFLYKPFHLAREGGEVTVCTMVQLVHAAIMPTKGQTTFVKAVKRKDPKPASGMAASDAIRNMLDMLENIMGNREVDLGAVQQLHQVLLKGEVFAQPSHIAEQLVRKEELDQEVGNNLLQLLGADSRQPDVVMTNDGSETSGTNKIGSNGFNATQGIELEFVPHHIVPQVEQLLSQVEDWRFDALKLAAATQNHPLSTLAFWLFKRYGIISQFQLDETKLVRFLCTVEQSYPDNPYHNRTHAADVLQGMHVLLTKGGLNRRLQDELAIIAGYLAAMIHDFEHKGLNNDFLVRVGDDLALTYNDISPMENHHVAGSFKLMRKSDCNFLGNMPKEKWVRLRKLLIDMVLATDMKQHFNILSKFQAKLQVKLRTASVTQLANNVESLGGNDDGAPIVDDEADKSLILQVGLKCADVGHLAAPWDVHQKWVERLEEEFFRQGDQEKERHMGVSPLMDRCKDGITRSQVGFFDIVALPLFYSWATVFQDALPLVKAVEDNCNRWKVHEADRSQGKR